MPSSTLPSRIRTAVTPIPVATLQQSRIIYNSSSKLMGKYCSAELQGLAAHSREYQRQQRQLPAFPPPQGSTTPAGAVAESAEPPPAPASSFKQLRATFNF
ncbi:hypothetical protein E4U59_007830 [Claviceps monticola]|nr:hypothetical protein E4U59_007830 [Claviceps monticola]